MKSWMEVSSNPNSPEALESRRSSLSSARRKSLIYNRSDYLSQLVEGKEVLDVGVVEHFIKSSERDNWLHGILSKRAKTCIGIDILEEEVAQLCERGYEVVVCDITKDVLARKFEVIIVGDVIEHTGNPSGLFENAKKMLLPDGRLVLSTPNPWYANVIIKNLVGKSPFTDSVDHVGWYDASTLCELANRNGFILDSYFGEVSANSPSIRSRLFFKLSPLLIRLGFKPEIFAKTMLYEFTILLDK